MSIINKVKNRVILENRSVLLFLALTLGACASPVARVNTANSQLQHAQIYYVQAEQFKSAQFDPPPAINSDAQKADLAAVLDWQTKRSAADCARAALSADSTYAYFWGDKSPFKDPVPSEVKEFFGNIASDLETATNNMKNHYQRLRPFNGYPDEVKPCIRKSKGYSYPSGHSTFSRVFAHVLSDIIPERRSEFFAKADEIANDRVIGGVHYPADVAAGKLFGDKFYDELVKSPAYQKDVLVMKALLVKQ